jgi:transcriptional regulator with XRE-family HTH domain
MDPEKQARLEAGGWKIGTVAEFLGLTADEDAEVEARVSLDLARARVATLITTARKRHSNPRVTQKRLAALINSSQSRVAKIEAADPSVSLDLIVKAAVAAGADLRQIGEAIQGP